MGYVHENAKALRPRADWVYATSILKRDDRILEFPRYPLPQGCRTSRIQGDAESAWGECWDLNLVRELR